MTAPRHRPALRKLRSLAYATALVLGGAALNGTDALSEVANAGAQVSDEIRQFCSNIADAAKDRRYALQVLELEKLKKDIDDRVAKLEAKRAEYEDWLKRREEFMARAEASVVDIYAKMKPDAAAERLSDVEPMLVASILMKLNTRQAGVILNEMKSKSAAKLTGIMAAAAKPQDPS
jgi:flagellar motility protein MotE (MotC chaperone)